MVPNAANHVNGMGPDRAVRIWGLGNSCSTKPVCRCAVCSSFHPASPLHANARNTVTKEHLSPAALAYVGSPCKLLGAGFLRFGSNAVNSSNCLSEAGVYIDLIKSRLVISLVGIERFATTVAAEHEVSDESNLI